MTFTVVDLFCGAGGLSTGLHNAGFVPIKAIDSFSPAIESYSASVGPHASLETISESTDLPNANVFAGGPPCQGFSSAGLRRNGDERNSLVGVFSGLIARYLPDAFIFENVEGFLTTEGGTRVLELLEPLIDAGYQIHLRKVNAANYGVPQHRKRIIAIGGLGWAPNFPEPTHFAYGAPGATLIGDGLPRAPTVWEVIGDLPPPSEDENEAEIPDHVTRPLCGIDLERAAQLGQGQKMGDLPKALRHASYNRRANRRVMDGTPSERRGGAPSGVRRLRENEPSKAITASARSEFVHPRDDRTLTLRECARLQTFPDDFRFLGSLADKATLIGNAVPPLLAHKIGIALHNGLTDRRPTRSPGKLLSFVATLSSGMSPALLATTEMIRRRFGGIKSERQLARWH